MPTKRFLNPSTLARTQGFTPVVKAGDTVYISGQVARDAQGTLVGKGDPEAQARQVYRNLKAAVEAGGGTLSDIVKLTTYVTTPQCVEACRNARQEMFPASPPASTMVIVQGLASPDFLVEVEAIAVV